MRPRPSVAVFLASLLALLSGCAATRTVRRDTLRYDGTLASLPGGARLGTVSLAGAPRAVVEISYAAGWSADPPGKEGTAELSVRLARQSRSARGGFTIGERLFALGAVTSERLVADAYVLEATVRARRLPGLLAIEADRAREPLAGVEEADLAREREQYARSLELGLEPGGPPARQLGEVWRAAWAGSTFGRPMPSPASVRAITLEDVRAWCAAAFAPSRAALVVTGPARHADVLPLAEAGWSSAAPPAPAPAAPTPPSPSRALQRRKVADGPRTLWVAWRLPWEGTPPIAFAHALLNVARVRLGQARRPWDPPPLAFALEPGLTLGRKGAVFHVQALLEPGADAESVRAALVASLTSEFDAPARGLAEAARREFDLSFTRGLETEGVRDGALLAATSSEEPVVARWRHRVELETPTFTRLLGGVLRPDAAVSLVFEPENPDAPAPQLPGELRWMTPFEVLSVAAPGAEEVRSLVDGPQLAASVRKVLPNGLEVVVIPRGVRPALDARLVIRPDAAASPALQSLALQVSERAWTPAGSWLCQASPRSSSGAALSFEEKEVATSDLSTALGRLACATQRVAPREDAFVRVRDVWAREAERATAPRGPVAAVRDLQGGLYGTDSLAVPDAAALRAIRHDDVRRWLREGLAPERSLLVVAGRVDPAQALAEAERTFGAWARGGGSTPPGSHPAPAARRVFLHDVPGWRVGFAVVGMRLPGREAADEAAERVLAQLLAARALRAGGPFATVRGLVAGAPEAPSLQLLGLGPAADLGKLVRAALGGPGASPSSRVDLLDVATARWLAAREEAFRYDDPASLAGLAEALFLQGRPLDAADRIGDDLAAVDAARVEATARTLGGREIVLVVGDAKLLGPALRAAGVEYEERSAPGPARKE